MMQLVLLGLVTLFNSSVLPDDPPKAPDVKKPALREEILKRTKVDQDARFALINWMKANGSLGKEKQTDEQKAEYARLADTVKQADTENTKWLKELIEKHGWLTFSLVGKDGGQSAWLMVQHADADPKFQRSALI